MKTKVQFVLSTPCLTRVKTIYPDLSGVSKKIADFVLQNAEKAIFTNVSELATSSCVSDASIIRFCKQLGYSGYNEFKINLASEVDFGGTDIFEDVNIDDDSNSIIEKVFISEKQALTDTLEKIDREHFKNAVNAVAFSNKVIFFAVGNARPIIQDAHYRLLRIGVNVRIGVDEYDSLFQATILKPGDVAIAVSHSGYTRNTINMLAEARRSGATTICLTGNPNAEILKHTDIALVSTSQETMFRSVAMSSRIAQMAIIDALVVGVGFTRYERSKKFIGLTDKILASEKDEI